MKNYWKSTTMALTAALALGLGSNFVAGQSTPAPAVTPAPSTTRGERGPGMRGERQPHMAMALVALQRAREQLDQAVADKGGFREKALKDVDAAIVDVKDGMKYAIDHPEEYGRGERGGRGGAGGNATGPSTAPSAVPKT